MTIWLENPGAKRRPRKRATAKKTARRGGRPLKKGSKAAREYMAHLRTLRKGAKPVAKRKTARKRTTTRRRTTARKRAAPRRKTTRRRRSNPPKMFGRGLVKKVTKGVGNAVTVEAGRIGTRTIARKIEEAKVAGGGAPFTPWAMTAVQAATAIGLGLLADSFLGARVGEFALAGALAVPTETAALQLNVPIINDALSGGMGRYVMRAGGGGRALNGVGRYDNRTPKALSSGMGRYVNGGGVAAVPDPIRPGIPGVRSALSSYFESQLYD